MTGIIDEGVISLRKGGEKVTATNNIMQGISGTGSYSGTRADNKTESGSGFDSIINMSINNLSQTSGKDNKADKIPDTSTYDTKTTKKDAMKDAVDTEKADKAEKSDDGKSSKSVTDKEVSKVDKHISDKDDFTNSLNELEGELKKKICDALSVSEEELEMMLAGTGMTVFMLLDPENVKEFSLMVNMETDVSAILTNESVSDTMNLITQAVNEVDVEEITGMSKEEIAKLANDTMAMRLKLTQFSEGEDVSVISYEAADTEDVSMQSEDIENITYNSKKTDATKEIDIKVVKEEKADTDSSDGAGNPGQDNANQSDSEIAKSNYNTFIENLKSSVNVNEMSANFTQSMSEVREMTQIVNQIVDSIKVNISTDSTSMELMLNPENLGRVNLSVQAKNGVMTASFVVENETARQAIESQIIILRENLESQGIKVDAVEVTVSNMDDFTRNESFGGGASQSEGNEKKRNRSINLNAVSDTVFTDEEQMLADIMKDNGTSVDYTA